MKDSLFQLNAGTGMALGVIIAAIIAVVVQVLTRDGAVWIWAIPVGIAVGLAVGAGAQKKTRNKAKDPGGESPEMKNEDARREPAI